MHSKFFASVPTPNDDRIEQYCVFHSYLKSNSELKDILYITWQNFAPIFASSYQLQIVFHHKIYRNGLLIIQSFAKIYF